MELGMWTNLEIYDNFKFSEFNIRLRHRVTGLHADIKPCLDDAQPSLKPLKKQCVKINDLLRYTDLEFQCYMYVNISILHFVCWCEGGRGQMVVSTPSDAKITNFFKMDGQGGKSSNCCSDKG